MKRRVVDGKGCKSLTDAEVERIRGRLAAAGLDPWDDGVYMLDGDDHGQTYWLIAVDQEGIVVRECTRVLKTLEFRDLRKWLHESGIEV